MNETDNSPRELVWTPELVARFWDWQSRFPENYFAHQFGRGIADRLRPQFSGARRILDFGCGAGFLIPHLANLGAVVWGCDVSPESLAKASRHNAKTAGFGGVALTPRLLETAEKFDAIVCAEVVEHLYDDALALTLETIRKLCAPGAIVAVTTPNDEDLRRSQVYCPVSNVVFHRWQHVRSWTSATLEDFLKARGFRVISTVETDLSVTSARYRFHKLRRKLLRKEPATPHLVCTFDCGRIFTA